MGRGLASLAVRRRLGAGFSRIASPGPLWWCAVALAVGGAVEVLFALIFMLQTVGWLTPGSSPGYDYRDFPILKPAWLRSLDAAFLPLYVAGLLLISLSLGAGLRALLKRRPGARAAVVGALLAATSPAIVTGILVHRASPAYYYGTENSPILYLLSYGAWPVGVVLLGAAALRVRGLGRWRPLPLVLGLLALAFSLAQVALYLSEPVSPGYGSPLMLALQRVAALWFLAQAPIGLACLLLARPLAQAPRRERALTEAENLARAERLYREAWVNGKLGVLDESAAPGCEDRYGNGNGPESLKRSVVGLRRSFPDLRFAVTGQEARGDEVITTWTASGTDRGGVLWYPPTGRSASFGGEFVDRFEAGMLVEHSGHSETADLLRQLGLPRT
jgi:predicted ester cyclase